MTLSRCRNGLACRIWHSSFFGTDRSCRHRHNGQFSLRSCGYLCCSNRQWHCQQASCQWINRSGFYVHMIYAVLHLDFILFLYIRPSFMFSCLPRTPTFLDDPPLFAQEELVRHHPPCMTSSSLTVARIFAKCHLPDIIMTRCFSLQKNLAHRFSRDPEEDGSFHRSAISSRLPGGYGLHRPHDSAGTPMTSIPPWGYHAARHCFHRHGQRDGGYHILPLHDRIQKSQWHPAFQNAG